MNSYSARQLWSFGQLLKKNEGKELDFGGININYESWFELTTLDEWEEFVDRKEVTKDQLAIIKQGYVNKPLQNPEQENDIIFPFGSQHKGKPISQVPIDYIIWCSKQDWIEKWPTLYNWIKQNQSKLEEETKGQADLMNELSELNKKLKQ